MPENDDGGSVVESDSKSDGATSSTDSTDESGDFDWLDKLDFQYEDSIIPYEWSNPAKSLEFGADGFTASVTDWHELLQVTAPHPLCGVVYARGWFPDTPDAIIARSQIRDDTGSKGTWGLQILPESDFELGSGALQGLVDSKWPFFRYKLVHKLPDTAKSKKVVNRTSGEYNIISFVKDGTLYQVARLTPGELPNVEQYDPEPAPRDQHTEGSVRDGNLDIPLYEVPGSRRHSMTASHAASYTASHTARAGIQTEKKKMKISFRVGGRVRFFCSCGTGPGERNDYAKDKVYFNDDHCACLDSDSFNQSLLVQTFVDGKPAIPVGGSATSQESSVTRQNTDTSLRFETVFESNKPVIIVVAIKLIPTRPIGDPIPSLSSPPSSEEMAKYLKLDSSYAGSSTRIWKTVWQLNEDAEEGSEESADIRAIMSSLERILHVTAVPVPLEDPDAIPVVSSDQDSSYNASIRTDPDSQPLTTKDDQETLQELLHSQDTVRNLGNGPTGSNPDFPVALTNSMINPQLVDLRSTFWQIRFVIKAYRFLDQFTDTKLSTGEDEPPISKEEFKAYQAKIFNLVQGAVVWLVRAVLSRPSFIVMPASRQFYRVEDFLHSIDSFYDLQEVQEATDFCYPVMTLWYVMKYLPQAISEEFKTKTILPNLRKFQEACMKRELEYKKEKDLKYELLMWYNHACMAQICKGFAVDMKEKGLPDPARLARRSLEQALRLSRKPKSGSTDFYTSADELSDRLALLAEELISTSEAETIGRQARARIVQRSRTSSLNPGHSRFTTTKTNSPWELSCLSHHGSLRTALYAPESVDIRAAKADCFQFQSSDYTFLATWDRSRKDMVAEWFNIDVSSIVCATLLDLKQKDVDKLLRPQPEPIQGKTVDPKAAVDASSSKDVARRDEYLRELLDRQNKIIDLLRKPTTGTTEFDWTNARFLRQEGAFPKAWVQSLQDTPRTYHLEQIQKVQLRAEIKRYLRRKNGGRDPQPRTWTLENVRKQVPLEDILYVNIFDITLTRENVYDVLAVYGRIMPVLYMLTDGGEDRELFAEGEQLDGIDQNQSQPNPSLWAYFLDNKVTNYPHFERLSKAAQAKLVDPKARREILHDYHTELLRTLNDSLVDQDVRNRIFHVQHYSPNLVEAFIYMWHRDGLDTWDSHFSPTSRFTNVKSDVWITTITISHLEIEDTSLDEIFREHRENPLTVPLSEKAFHRKKHHILTRNEEFLKFGDASSSLAITGDPRGAFWNCLLISSAIDEISMDSYVRGLDDNMTLFKHQPAVGRSLTFLTLLGHVCVHLGKTYDRMIGVLMEKLNLAEKVLMMGYDWEAGTDAVYGLWRMIVCLEALRVFDDRLSSSLSEINEAKEAIIREIVEARQETGEYHKELEQIFKTLLEEFDKRQSSLAILHTKIQQRVEQISRLRDGISTITNLEDSRAAMKQNNNIRVLTYITIAYLPLSYVAALFSINGDFLPGHAGRGAYAWLTIVFVVVTFAAAFCIEKVVTSWSDYKKHIFEKHIKAEVSSNENKTTTHTTTNPDTITGFPGEMKIEPSVIVDNFLHHHHHHLNHHNHDKTPPETKINSISPPSITHRRHKFRDLMSWSSAVANSKVHSSKDGQSRSSPALAPIAFASKVSDWDVEKEADSMDNRVPGLMTAAAASGGI